MAWYNIFRKSAKPCCGETLDLPSVCEVGEPSENQVKRQNFLEALTEGEIKTLKEAMMTARANYRTAIGIIAKNQDTNPRYIVMQQGTLEDILRGYVHGSGLG